MSGGQGLQIAAVDYNAIRNDVISVLGAGTGQRGYGQPLYSSAVSPGNDILKAHWDALRLDILNISLHQTGVYPPIVTLGENAVIGFGAGHPNTNYASLAAQVILNKFSIGAGQSILSTAATQTYTSAWGTQAQCTVTVTFPDSNRARYFFNSGGKLRFTSSRTGGSSTQQNSAWTNLLNTTVGTITFGGNTPEITNFYTLTTAYQQVYQVSSSTPYSANYYRIEALCNCSEATNINGTASTVTFRITWRDDYIDGGAPAPGDSVDGTLAITVEELKATGAMLPTGSPLFSITSPGYSVSTISAS